MMARSPQNFKLVRESDGTTYDMDTINVIVKSLKIHSPYPVHTRETIDNRHGYIHFNTTYGYRKLDADVRLFPTDNIDFELFRNELFKSLNALDSFHLIRDLEAGKRMKVYLEDSFSFDRDGVDGEGNISFTSPSPFWESVGTTLDPFTFDSDLWQIGQGLRDDVDETDYTQTTSSFTIPNLGDVDVNPRELPLKITYTGASTNLTITNDTTGDSWSYTGTSNTGDTIVLDGVKSTKNSLSIFKDTNRQLITLKRGDNSFTITGATNPFTIQFEFRFYYL